MIYVTVILHYEIYITYPWSSQRSVVKLKTDLSGQVVILQSSLRTPKHIAYVSMDGPGYRICSWKHSSGKQGSVLIQSNDFLLHMSLHSDWRKTVNIMVYSLYQYSVWIKLLIYIKYWKFENKLLNFNILCEISYLS